MHGSTRCDGDVVTVGGLSGGAHRDVRGRSARGMGGRRRSQDPSRKRGRWRVKRIKVASHGATAGSSQPERTRQDIEILCLGEPPPASLYKHTVIAKKLKEIAPSLWASSYAELLADELHALQEHHMLMPAMELKAAAPPSTYVARGLVRHKEEHAAKQVAQAGDMAAQAMRQANQQVFPFSVCARSVAMYMHRVPVKDWKELCKKRSVLSRPTTVKLIHEMMACRPKPNFETRGDVRMHVFDQTFRKKGASRAVHRAAERVDASGALVDLINMVIVNSVSVPLPSNLGKLSDVERNQLVTTGPYTKPFRSILPAVQPAAVIASTFVFMEGVGGWIRQARERFSLDGWSELRTAIVARALLGRPNVCSSRAYLRVNKPILNCDTKSIEDGVRIVNFLEQLDSPLGHRPEVLMCMGDGQSVLLLSYLKRRFPERYRHVLICCGNFHAFGHFLFGGQQSFHDCYTGFWAKKLGREKVPKFIASFEQDSYMHVLALLSEITIGTYTYFMADVTFPPPLLLLDHPDSYYELLENAGAKVAFKFLQFVGVPLLHWVQAGREADGGKCEKLHALAFHMNRATTHKVNYVRIALLALMSTLCVSDGLAEIVRATVAFTITGNVGSLMYGDRTHRAPWRTWSPSRRS